MKRKKKRKKNLVKSATPHECQHHTCQRAALRELTELASTVPVVADSPHPSLLHSGHLLPHRQLQATHGVALRVAGVIRFFGM